MTVICKTELKWEKLGERGGDCHEGEQLLEWFGVVSEVWRNEWLRFRVHKCRVTHLIIDIRMFLYSKGRRQSQAKGENAQQVETAV